MSAGDPKRKIFSRLSSPTIAVVGLTAALMGLLSFPFAFAAFGPRDNPFDSPIELFWIVLLTAGAVPVLLVLVFVRRALLTFTNAG